MGIFSHHLEKFLEENIPFTASLETPEVDTEILIREYNEQRTVHLDSYVLKTSCLDKSFSTQGRGEDR
jgi:hypothetical protein